LIIVLSLVFSAPLPFVLFVCLCGIVYSLPSVIVNQRLFIGQDRMLIYQLLMSKRRVNLNTLTDCKYRLSWGGRKPPVWIFHLYDASGNYVNLPANCWWRRNDLYATLREAVMMNSIEVNEKTAKKLSIN
jgi:hypothetical protein